MKSTTQRLRQILGFLAVCLTQIIGSAGSSSADNLEQFAQRLSLVPSPFETTVSHPGGTFALRNRATCFPLNVALPEGEPVLLFVVNHHQLTCRDSVGNVISETDTGLVFRNAADTVITLRVKVVSTNPRIDLALMQMVDPIPSALDIETTGIKINLRDDRCPRVGERILYGGFPLLLGRDTRLKQNYPLVIDGVVSQVVPGIPSFIVQAPIFSGASGSPIVSQRDGKFLGVIYGKVTDQESLLFAVRGDEIRAWIREILSADDPPW